MSRRQVHSITPLFVVADVERSAAYYCDVLGFEDPSFFGTPATSCMLNRDGHDLMLRKTAGANDITPNGRADAWDMYMKVADVAAEKDGIERAGGSIVAGPRDTFYEMREIEVIDPDGYRICLAQDMS